ncbi:MAG: alpha/beta fold hydrolase [Gemmatimonadaceae bacterium]
MAIRAIHLLALAGVALLARPLAHGVLAFWHESRQFIAKRWAVKLPDDAAQLKLRDISFIARDGAPIRGWYIPSRNRAALVMCQGSSSDRSALLSEARALSAVGFGVLLFDWPGTGESGGKIRFGAPERAALQSALDYLVRQTDVDSARVGAFGFSMGGFTVAQVAAIDTRIRSVVLVGTPDDARVQTRREYAKLGVLAVWGGILALHVMRMPLDEMRPSDVVASIAPRPLLIVTGSTDIVVPSDLSRHIFDAAKDPKEFWLIEGAGHGTYAAIDSSYYHHISQFFVRTLGPDSQSVQTPSTPRKSPLTSHS